MTSKQTIELIRDDSANVWLARFSDPSIKARFGTDTLPTPFTASADRRDVLACVRERNPDCVVTVKPFPKPEPNRVGSPAHLRLLDGDYR